MSGETIAGRYRLERLLGEGATSSSWLAHDLGLGRPAAVKLLGPEADPDRFEREARAVALLEHPHILRHYDHGTAEEVPYMVLEHRPGRALDERLAVPTGP